MKRVRDSKKSKREERVEAKKKGCGDGRGNKGTAGYEGGRKINDCGDETGERE